MEKGFARELLCFTEKDMIFAIDFSHVVEICFHIAVQQIPCLPKEFCGVYHYKGEIVPIVTMDNDRHRETQECVILIVNSGEYTFGIRIESEPWICNVDEHNIVGTSESEQPGCWREEQIYKVETDIIHLLDLGKTSLELAELC